MTRRRTVVALLVTVGLLLALAVVPAAFVTDSCAPTDRAPACGTLGRNLPPVVLVAGLASALLAGGAVAARRWRPLAVAAAAVQLVALGLVTAVLTTLP